MTDWENLLAATAMEVQRVCESVRSKGDIARKVGLGAAGDETLLADREAERVIVDALLSVEGVRVLSEEAGEIGPSDAKLLAVVDPLDGSSNFSRGISFYGTSICLVEGRRLGEAKFALVRDLVSGAVYHAERGRGAFRDGARLKPSSRTELAESVAAVDVSKAGRPVVEAMVPLSSKLGRQVHFGANALEMCMVADGTVDAFVDLRRRMRVTDVAGAWLVVKEAGAAISTETGAELDPTLDLRSRLSVVAAANARLHQNVLGELASVTGRRR